MFDAVSTVIPGAKTPEQARANAAASELPPLDDGDNAGRSPSSTTRDGSRRSSTSGGETGRRSSFMRPPRRSASCEMSGLLTPVAPENRRRTDASPGAAVASSGCAASAELAPSSTNPWRTTGAGVAPATLRIPEQRLLRADEAPDRFGRRPGRPASPPSARSPRRLSDFPSIRTPSRGSSRSIWNRPWIRKPPF